MITAKLLEIKKKKTKQVYTLFTLRRRVHVAHKIAELCKLREGSVSFPVFGGAVGQELVPLDLFKNFVHTV